jgi:hypothetical protein
MVDENLNIAIDLFKEPKSVARLTYIFHHVDLLNDYNSSVT